MPRTDVDAQAMHELKNLPKWLKFDADQDGPGTLPWPEKVRDGDGENNTNKPVRSCANETKNVQN